MHLDAALFKKIIDVVSSQTNINPILVEKDYYVWLFLKELSSINKTIVFKGGTSLSKCYKAINRFSEDIDLTVNFDNISKTKGRELLKENIIEVSKKLSIKIENIDDIQTRKDFNQYIITYQSVIMDAPGRIIIETSVSMKAFPIEKRPIGTIIKDTLVNMNEVKALEILNLDEFNINVQSIQRTFIDKVFAICDYYEKDKQLKYSRHIYDLYCISKIINIVNIKDLIDVVRIERCAKKSCVSASSTYNVNSTLKKIIDEEFYKKDYQEITAKLLYDNVSYEDAILIIDLIIDSNIFL